MKRHIQRIIILAGSLSIFWGPCANAGNKSDPEYIEFEPITYIIPKDVKQTSKGVANGYLRFPKSSKGRSTKRLVIFAKEGSSGEFSYTKKIVNRSGVGSGITYKVTYAEKESKDNIIIKVKPLSYITYQQGIIGKFKVPKFSLKSLEKNMFRAMIRTKENIEVNSQYPEKSVISNFSRLLGDPIERNGKKYYPVKVNGIKYPVNVKAFPYRNGSKVVAKLIYIKGYETSSRTIDFNIVIDALEKEITRIVNN